MDDAGPRHKVLLLGATGGIGRHALARLLEHGVETTVIVRSADRLLVHDTCTTARRAAGDQLLTVVVEPRGHLALDAAAWQEHVRGCDAVISCLGHNLSFRGIWGAPRRLCAETTRVVCEAVRALAPPAPVKYIVVNTEGVDRLDGADPPRGWGERLVLWMLQKVLPPHADNMATLAYLTTETLPAGKNPHVSFCAVRPSNLTDSGDGATSAYTLHATLQNGIFNAGETRRANVGAFMADLVSNPDLWAAWADTFPHILDDEVSAAAAEGGTCNNAVAPAADEEGDGVVVST